MGEKKKGWREITLFFTTVKEKKRRGEGGGEVRREKGTLFQKISTNKELPKCQEKALSKKYRGKKSSKDRETHDT
jgi:hypothetical protein